MERWRIGKFANLANNDEFPKMSRIFLLLSYGPNDPTFVVGVLKGYSPGDFAVEFTLNLTTGERDVKLRKLQSIKDVWAALGSPEQVAVFGQRNLEDFQDYSEYDRDDDDD